MPDARAVAERALARLNLADAVRVRAEGDGVALLLPQGLDNARAAMAQAAVEAALGAGKTRMETDASRAAPPETPEAPEAQAKPTKPPKPAKALLIVASGKGGVGKSVVALGLARAFVGASAKLRVGLLDADVHGPSLPTMLGVQRPAESDGANLMPLMFDNLAVMSMGFLVKPGAAMTWRGPMASSAATQTLNRTAWGERDLIIIDAPPGTGDVLLSFAQQAELDGAVVVSTPHPAAIADAERALAMFARLGVPVRGVIENMAWMTLPDGTRAYPFGRDGARRMAEAAKAPFLAALPFDAGLGSVPAAPPDALGAEAREAFTQAARELGGALGLSA